MIVIENMFGKPRKHMIGEAVYIYALMTADSNNEKTGWSHVLLQVYIDYIVIFTRRFSSFRVFCI